MTKYKDGILNQIIERFKESKPECASVGHYFFKLEFTDDEKKIIINSLKLENMITSRIKDLKQQIADNIKSGLSSGSINTFLDHELRVLEIFVGKQDR